MQRGIVELTSPQIALLLEKLHQSAQTIPLTLDSASNHISNTLQTLTVELSETEVETLLDQLPVPNQSTEIEKKLRTTLTTFLQKMRNITTN